MKFMILCCMIFMLFGCITTQSPQMHQTKQPTIEQNLLVDNEAKVLGSLSATSLGRHIGNYTDKMDFIDKRNLGQIFETQQSGITRRWHNTETDIVYAVTPTRNHQYTDGSLCREYVIEMYQENDVKEFYGRACRQTDGTWVIVN